MKKKGLLLSALSIVTLMVLFASQVNAQVSTGDGAPNSSSPTFTINIPTAAAWKIVPSTNTLSPTARDFNFTGAPAPLTNDTSRNTITFGVGVPDSYLITNDDANVKGQAVTISTSGCTFKGVAANTCNFKTGTTTLNFVKTNESDFDVIFTNEAGSGAPEIGGKAFAESGNNLVKANGTDMTIASHQYPLDLKMDLDESTLSEADIPGAAVFTLVFTVAGVTY